MWQRYEGLRKRLDSFSIPAHLRHFHMLQTVKTWIVKVYFWMFLVIGWSIQWGSENQTFKIWIHSKSRHFEGRILNGRPFNIQTKLTIKVQFLNGFGQNGCLFVQTIWKLEKCPVFKWSTNKMAIHLKSDRHSNSRHGRPFENRTCTVFGSPLYLDPFCNALELKINKKVEKK